MADKKDPFCVGKPDLKLENIPSFLKMTFNLNCTNIKPLESYDDQNFRCEEINTKKLYVLKILNHEYTRTEESVHLTVSRIMSYLTDQSLPCQKTYFTKNMKIKTVGGEELDCLVRVLDYLPGRDLSSILPLSVNCFVELGEYMRKIHDLMKNCENIESVKSIDSIKERVYLWDISKWNVNFEDYIEKIEDPDIKSMVRRTQSDFKRVHEILDKNKTFIHTDLNLQNILGAKDESTESVDLEGKVCKLTKITGLLDFNDSAYLNPVYDIGNLLGYCCNNCIDYHGEQVFGDVCKLILKGYDPSDEIIEVLKECLYTCLCSRLCQSVSCALARVAEEPENSEYLLVDAGPGMKTLKILSKYDRQGFNKLVFEKIWTWTVVKLKK